MTLAEALKRTLPVLLFASISIACGLKVGQLLATSFLSVPPCIPQGGSGRYVTGGLGLFATLISIFFSASKAGFIHIDNLYRFVRYGDRTKYRLVVDNAMLALAAFVFSGLLSFSYGATFDKCKQPLQPPECQSAFDVCRVPLTESDCLRCTVEEGIRAARRDIDRLQLQRVGAFPLVFDNARTSGRGLSHHGVQLTSEQFASWHGSLFGDGPWPDAAVDDVAYCVLGFSSTARFVGKSPEISNQLNLETARCRAESVAKELVPFLKRRTSPRVASCHWANYVAMKRPHLLAGAHLGEADRDLISRSVFVHGFSLLGKNDRKPTDGFDVGAACGNWVAQKLGVQQNALCCSTFDGADDGSPCPQPPQPHQGAS